MYCVGDWVGSEAGVDAVEKRKTSCPCQQSNPDFSVVQPVVLSLHRLSYPLSLAKIIRHMRRNRGELLFSDLYCDFTQFSHGYIAFIP
jgi:hypothetical protein